MLTLRGGAASHGDNSSVSGSRPCRRKSSPGSRAGRQPRSLRPAASVNSRPRVAASCPGRTRQSHPAGAASSTLVSGAWLTTHGQSRAPRPRSGRSASSRTGCTGRTHRPHGKFGHPLAGEPRQGTGRGRRAPAFRPLRPFIGLLSPTRRRRPARRQLGRRCGSRANSAIRWSTRLWPRLIAAAVSTTTASAGMPNSARRAGDRPGENRSVSMKFGMAVQVGFHAPAARTCSRCHRGKVLEVLDPAEELDRFLGAVGEDGAGADESEAAGALGDDRDLRDLERAGRRCGCGGTGGDGGRRKSVRCRSRSRAQRARRRGGGGRGGVAWCSRPRGGATGRPVRRAAWRHRPPYGKTSSPRSASARARSSAHASIPRATCPSPLDATAIRSRFTTTSPSMLRRAHENATGYPGRLRRVLAEGNTPAANAEIVARPVTKSGLGLPANFEDAFARRRSTRADRVGVLRTCSITTSGWATE